MKVVCNVRQCNWKGTQDQILNAPHPFTEGERVYGCPHCEEIDSIVGACDEPDCWEIATCGTPTIAGYRRTCYKHAPVSMTTQINPQPTGE